MGSDLDIEGLACLLRKRCEGEVRFSWGDRALYATDASNYRQMPIGLVVPRTAEDIEAAFSACREFGAPVFLRGAGTSLAGQCCNEGVVIDTSKYLNRILELDPAARTATVEPGVILDALRRRAGKHGLTFAPDPSTHDRCTLGGMIGNNSCGVHSVMAGKTVDNVEELEILTYRGVRTTVGATSDAELERIERAGGPAAPLYRALRDLIGRAAPEVRDHFPKIPRRVSGYNLDDLLPENGFHVARSLVGSESTCAGVLTAKLRLVPSPPARCLAVLGFEDICAAADRVPEILGFGPIGLEGLDDYLVECMRTMKLSLADLPNLPPGKGWLMAEFGGEDLAGARAGADRLVRWLDQSPHDVAVRLLDDPAIVERTWSIRKSALGATSFVPGRPPAWAGWEDAAVAPDRLGDYLREFLQLTERYGYRGGLYGHFGDGCIHTRLPFDLRSAPGRAKFRSFVEEAADLTVGMGGSLSGEHGDGQARGSLLPRMFGPVVMDAFRDFKRIWDPDGKMNPGKLIDADPVDAHLRLGEGYRPANLPTVFDLSGEPGGSGGEGLAGAALRCVGVGKCRRESAGTMCPSYMATREEKHSTRGRAHLLFELLQEGPSADPQAEDEVKEALDLCLACKACKSECPVNVDMATYKAEFLARYYRNRRRPAAAYGMGYIHLWLRAGAVLPQVANLAVRPGPVADLVKKAVSIAPQREIPRLAPRAFRREFSPGTAGSARVVLWPDTFNAYLRPGVLHAAAEVLTGAGCRVAIPEQTLCCGRPLYDFGMLGQARRMLRRIVDALAPDIEAGTRVVVAEPGCLSVFRDELTKLLPGDERARRLGELACSVAELLGGVEGYRPPRIEQRAIYHAHCHHKSVIGTAPDVELLRAAGLDLHVLDAGCCGMAGSFGFAEEHYDVSMACGERVLLPAVRQAPERTLLIADGFSCREQIEQSTGRKALHSAEVLQYAARLG